MPILVESNNATNTARNTGANRQVLEGPVVKYAIATTEQEFATTTAAKALESWKTDVLLKKIIPFYDLEELAVADTADSYYEGNTKYKTANGKKIRTFNMMIGLPSHNAVASYDGKKMRLYEFTDKQEIKAISNDGVKVKGQMVTIEVGKRVDAMKDKPPYTPVTLTYEDYREFENDGHILRPDWSPTVEVKGIIDAIIELVSQSATSVKFKVLENDTKDPITSLKNDDISYTTTDGAAITHSFIVADANGVYELTGTDFPTKGILNGTGVLAKVEDSYEIIAEAIMH
ncbi:hypothetical protein [Flavobacterium crassostreae]|nr:hypothetical protein [Flavobacterium crassostreae]